MIFLKKINLFKLLFIIFILLINFFVINNSSFGAWLGPAQCSDGTSNCGYIANVPLVDSCSMSGPDIVGNNRILGGQVCYTVGGQDSGGYYMNGTGEPNNNTPIFPFDSSQPWGWNYNKSSGILNYFGGSSIPTGVFQAEGPYYNLKFFNPINVNVNFNQPDDSGMLQIGSNYVYWTGCNAGPRDVFNANCPSKNFVGPTNFQVSPGASVSFKIENHLRPNNGYGIWGSGSVTVTFDNLTVCHTKSYFDYFCGFPGCSGRPNYIPTAAGVCSPESTQLKPRLDAFWDYSGTQTLQTNLSKDDLISTSFVIKNIGVPGSKMKIDNCNLSGGQGWLTISSCPQNQILNKNEEVRGNISIDSSNLSPGIYQASLYIYASDNLNSGAAQDSPKTLNIILEVSSSTTPTQSSASLTINGQTNASFYVGDSWNLKVETNPKLVNKPVQICATHNSQNLGCTFYGQTDSNGYFSLSGTFDNRVIGSWEEYAIVDGNVRSNTIYFNISNRTSNPSSTTSPPTTPPSTPPSTQPPSNNTCIPDTVSVCYDAISSPNMCGQTRQCQGTKTCQSNGLWGKCRASITCTTPPDSNCPNYNPPKEDTPSLFLDSNISAKSVNGSGFFDYDAKTLYVPINTDVNIEWSSFVRDSNTYYAYSRADYCYIYENGKLTDFTGSFYTFAVGQKTVNINSNKKYELRCQGAGTTTYDFVNIALEGVFVDLSANPNNGRSPLTSVLTAEVSGPSIGTINYTFWKNCTSNSTNVSETIMQCGQPDAKFDGLSDTTRSVQFQYVSNTNSTFTPKVIVERGNYSAEKRTTITVYPPLITTNNCFLISPPNICGKTQTCQGIQTCNNGVCGPCTGNCLPPSNAECQGNIREIIPRINPPSINQFLKQSANILFNIQF
ncbi:MAG: hypothetical protein RMK17_00090 [bacterium]|nr:hypothetical protein [bacterium]